MRSCSNPTDAIFELSLEYENSVDAINMKGESNNQSGQSSSIPDEDKEKEQETNIRINNFKDHMNIHTGENPYKCKFCTSCFASKGNQAQHLKSHLAQYGHIQSEKK